MSSPTGASSSLTYDGNGNQTSVLSGSKRLSSYTYDQEDQLLTATKGSGDEASTSSYTYDSVGNLTSITNGNGQVTKYSYDQLGNVIEKMNALGDSETYTYDVNNQLSKITKADGQTISYDYNKLDQLLTKKTSTESEGQVLYSYDADGRRVAMSDLTGQTRYAYNEEGELTGVRQGDGSLITYTYDDYGNITKMVYPDGSEVAYSYDELDRLTKVTDRDGKVTTYAYDKAGDMTKIERGDGTTSALTYDAAHRVTEIVHRDKKGKLISSYAYEYDDGNYIDKETITQDGETLVQTYTYDSLGQIVQMTVSSKDGKELSQFSYTYDHAGNKLTSTETVDGKESKTEFSYDAENRLLEMKSGDKTITYTYDKNGNRTSSGAGDAKLDYIYDTENRLLAVKDKEGLLFAALYDGDDNRVFTASRTQATNTYQLFKRKPADKKRKSPYTAPDGEANSLFWYGFTQNVVQFFSSFTTSEGYDWIDTFDTVSTAYHQKVAKDRATEEGLVVNPPSEDNLPGEDEVLYRSQVQDVLIPYTTKEDTYNYYETRNYVNDVNRDHTQVLQTYDDQLQKRETYVYGNGIATYTNENTGDSYHYLTSQSGSVTGLTQNGQAVASSSYALYGATKQTTDTTGNPFAYNGEARDVTGLDYLRARYYDNQAGIFLTADSYPGSQTDPLSQNLYAYVQNNPANYTDPSGHIRSPHVMLDDRFGGKVYKNPRPLINPDDGTLYAPSTPEHKAHQIRQQQTGNYSYVYTPKVYSNTPIIKPTSYAQAQAQRDRAREQALAEQRRQQNIRNEYSRATGSKGKAKLREAQNLFKNWGKALEETLKHVCNPQTTKGKDSGTRNKPNISVADFRKIEEANKYGLTVAEKAKIDKMSMSDLKSQYSSVIGNYNTYIGTGYFNPLGIGENRAVIERYKILKAEEEAKAAAQAAELAKYHYLNLYKHIQETGLRPDGTPATDLEKKIAPYVVAIPIIQDLSVAFAGRQYAKHTPHIPIENGMKWGVGSDQKTDTGKVYGPQPADGPLQPLKPYGPEQYSGPLQPLETPKVKVDFYVNPNGVATKANLGDSVTLYRGERSTVSPDIVFDLGFKPKGTSGDLRNHLTSNTTAGNFVSTSADKGIATDFAGKNGYLYEISSNRGIDVNKTLGSESPYPEQMEFSIPYGISSSEIKGAWSINKGVVGDYISNPNFGGGR